MLNVCGLASRTCTGVGELGARQCLGIARANHCQNEGGGGRGLIQKLQFVSVPVALRRGGGCFENRQLAHSGGSAGTARRTHQTTPSRPSENQSPGPKGRLFGETVTSRRPTVTLPCGRCCLAGFTPAPVSYALKRHLRAPCHSAYFPEAWGARQRAGCQNG